MRRVIEHEELRCDFCTRTERVERGGKPNGWTTIEFGPCGLTDYYTTKDRCADCTKRKRGE